MARIHVNAVTDLVDVTDLSGKHPEHRLYRVDALFGDEDEVISYHVFARSVSLAEEAIMKTIKSRNRVRCVSDVQSGSLFFID